MENSKVKGLLGLCKKAGKMTVGCELSVNAVRQKKGVLLLLTASDSSENTAKRTANCSDFYKVPHRVLPMTTEELGRLVGKGSNVAVIGICDKDFASAILAQL